MMEADVQTEAIKSWARQIGPGDYLKALSLIGSTAVFIWTAMSWAGDLKRDVVTLQTQVALMVAREAANSPAIETLKSSQLLQDSQIVELKEAAREGRQANSRIEQQLGAIREVLADLRARVPLAPATGPPR